MFREDPHRSDPPFPGVAAERIDLEILGLRPLVIARKFVDAGKPETCVHVVGVRVKDGLIDRLRVGELPAADEKNAAQQQVIPSVVVVGND